jgi:hypothetical protein
LTSAHQKEFQTESEDQPDRSTTHFAVILLQPDQPSSLSTLGQQEVFRPLPCGNIIKDVARGGYRKVVIDLEGTFPRTGSVVNDEALTGLYRTTFYSRAI